nr:AraC family transcriptional regulator ligand-binding domain-containing protein [Aquabacterium parvum]
MNVPRIHTSSTGAALLLDFMRSRGMVEPELQARLIGLCEAPRMPIEVWFGRLASLQQLAGSPSVGLDVASIVQPRHVGTLGYLAVHSDNIMQALTRYCRFQGLLHNVIEFNLMVEGSELVMRWFGHEQNPAPLVSDELFLGGHREPGPHPCFASGHQPDGRDLSPSRAPARRCTQAVLPVSRALHGPCAQLALAAELAGSAQHPP